MRFPDCPDELHPQEPSATCCEILDAIVTGIAIVVVAVPEGPDPPCPCGTSPGKAPALGRGPLDGT